MSAYHELMSFVKICYHWLHIVRSEIKRLLLLFAICLKKRIARLSCVLLSMDVAPKLKSGKFWRRQCVLGCLSKSDLNSLLLGNPLGGLILMTLVIRHRLIRQCSNDRSGYECHIRANETQWQSRRSSLAWSANSRDTVSDSNKPFRIANRHSNHVRWQGKEGLDAALRKLMERLFGSRILSAVIAYAPIVAAGVPVGKNDLRYFC